VLYCKFLRIEQDLTRQKLSQQSGVGPMVITRIESGVQNPTAEELGKLGAVLGVDPSLLLHHVNPSPLGDGAEWLDKLREDEAGK
jgi:transcriptional regulator with XRE-family HTH domain